MSDFFDNYFKNIKIKLTDLNYDFLKKSADIIQKVNVSNGKVIVVGNGGSAAIASHVSIDFTKAANIRSINFNESSLLTCFSNDYGYENWVDKALSFYADKNDLIILISSSGTSKNIVNGALRAKKMDLPIITFSGFSYENPLRKIGNINFWVDSNDYNLIETIHQTWCLSIIDYIIKYKNNRE
jgi:D-sedoheptulose 7-phosphate isomerase